MAGVLDELLQNVRQNDSDWKNAKDAIVLKGVPVPDGTPTSEYGQKILSIESGVDTSGDTVVPSALRDGYTAHDAAGQEITGTIPNYDGSITEGAVPGAEAKYEEGVADGKQAEYDAFWDGLQQNGKAYNYNRAFSSIVWDDDIYNPKYPFVGVKYYAEMFFLSNITDTKQPLDISSSTVVYGNVFRNCVNLVTIRTITVSENTTYENWFFDDTNLVNLTIEGTIGQGGLKLSWSPLSKASLISVINALSSTTTGLPVTLRLAAVNTAFETAQGSADGSSSEEWLNLIATKSNWTINLINS